jgi:hypothetical protein
MKIISMKFLVYMMVLQNMFMNLFMRNIFEFVLMESVIFFQQPSLFNYMKPFLSPLPDTNAHTRVAAVYYGFALVDSEWF